MTSLVARAPRAYFRALTLILAAVGMTTASPLAFGAECTDVRTGRAFTIPTARYSGVAARITGEALLGRLCVGALRATHAVALGDGAEGAFVVWVESSGEDCDLKLQHVSGDGGAFAGWPEGGRVVCAARGTQTQPAMALAGDGGVWVAWKDYREPRHGAIHLARLSASGEPAANYPADGRRIGDASVPASDPAIVADPAGGAWLFWQQGRSGERELRTLHFDESGARTDGWPDEGRVLVEGGQNAVRPAACGDAAGGVMLSWIAEAPGQSRLRLARYGAAGQPVPGWPGEGLELASSPQRLRAVALVADTSGSFVAWSEAGDDSTRSFLTHVTPGGAPAPAWPTGGRAIGAGSLAVAPTLALDGAGGVYLGWIGHAGEEAPGDVRLVRLDGNGIESTGWPAGGLPVTETPLDEHRPRLLALADGVLVSWGAAEAGGHGTVLSAALASLGALPALQAVETWPDLVRLSWQGAAEARYAVLVERTGGADEWELVRELPRDGGGLLVLEDHEVTPGEVLTYRLRLRTAELDVVTGEVRVAVPVETPLALRGLAVAGGVLHLAFSVPSRAETRFELFDVQGRRLLRDVRRHEHAGELTLQWPRPAGLRAGVFFARLTQAGQTRTRRFVLAGR